MPITIEKTGPDGLLYRWTWTPRADGSVAMRRTLDQSRGGAIEAVFTEDEWARVVNGTEDEILALETRPDDLKLEPTDGVKEARAKWGVIEAERKAQEAREAARVAAELAAREEEEAAIAVEKAAKEHAEAQAAKAAAAKAEAEAKAAEHALEHAKRLGALDKDVASMDDKTRAEFKLDCEKQIKRQAKVPGAPPPMESIELLEAIERFELGRGRPGVESPAPEASHATGAGVVGAESAPAADPAVPAADPAAPAAASAEPPKGD